MLDSMFANSTLPILEQVVGFTQARHGVLAGNIANMDTPGYRTLDLSPAEFQEQLKKAIEEQHSAAERPIYPSQAPGPMPSVDELRSEFFAKEQQPFKSMLRHDDNNASLEEQVTEIAKNHAQHNLALSLMTAQFRLLRAAITERA